MPPSLGEMPDEPWPSKVRAKPKASPFDFAVEEVELEELEEYYDDPQIPG
jgi:hypothetical protein